MYSVIVFDLGNVLIPFDYSKPVDYFNKRSAGLGDKFSKLYEENYHVHRNFEKGILSRKEFLVTMLDWLEHKITEEEFCKTFSRVFTVNADTVNLLPVLKEKYTLCLLSNTNEIHREYGWKQYEFLKIFDKQFLSYEVGALKPEENIYRAVEEFTHKPSSEHFFIDDVHEYVEGAKSCGWDGVQFVNFEMLIEDLKNRKIL